MGVVRNCGTLRQLGGICCNPFETEMGSIPVSDGYLQDRLFVAEDGGMREHGSVPCPGTSGTQGMLHNSGFSAMNMLLVLNS